MGGNPAILMKLSKKFLKGFTLIESLVIVSTVLTLGVLILPAFQLVRKQTLLQGSAMKLFHDLRRVQEMAMSTKEFHGIIPRGGYGIYLNNKAASYVLFADCNENSQYTPGNVCGVAPNKFSEEVETVYFESNVSIDNLSPGSPLNIVFAPPYPKITISYPSGIGQEAVIDLIFFDDPGLVKRVKANTAGLISIE